MPLPIKTTAEDVRKVVAFLKNKPTGVTVADAKAVVGGSLVDGRKLSAYKTWGVTLKDGEKYRLSPRGWDLARKPDQEAQLFREIIDSLKPYRAAIEWMFHQGFQSVTVIDIAAYWHEHHAQALGDEPADSTIRDSAIAFMHLCDAASLGKMTVGRSGNPTRLDIDRQKLGTVVEAGPSSPPWNDEADDADELPQNESSSTDTPPTVADSDQRVEIREPEMAPLRAFIAHGHNMDIVEQVQTMLELADIASEVAEAEETTAIPVPDKVFDAMRRCTAGIIVVSAEASTASDSLHINENVLIEIGAAFVLYDRRVVLLWDRRLPVPSNLQGLYRCEFEGAELSWSAGMKLMKAIQGFKK